MTHLSLFSGIGGLDLAAEWAGFETVGQCEYADYPTKVLEKHWPDVPRWRDVHDVTAESFRERTRRSDLTLLSGGFPCQPHSLAGKRLASSDERDLWGEFARCIRDIKPRWVLGENVAGLLSSENGRFFGRILRDLAEMGYCTGWACYPACWVGAIHRRERVFIVANANGKRLQRRKKQTGCNEMWTERNEQLQGFLQTGLRMDLSIMQTYREDNGIPGRVDRIKCLGNAVMPQQAFPILGTIATIERDSPKEERE